MQTLESFSFKPLSDNCIYFVFLAVLRRKSTLYKRRLLLTYLQLERGPTRVFFNRVRVFRVSLDDPGKKERHLAVCPS